MATIKMKRGLDSAIKNTILAQGEFGVATDTGSVYVGIEAGTYWVNPPSAAADEAAKLKNARNFSASGDATAAAVSFNGTSDVALVIQLANMNSLSAGTYTKLTVDAKGRVTGGTAVTVEDLPPIPANKLTGLGSAAALDTGTTAGKVVLVGEDGKLPEQLIPAVAISDTFEAETQAAMLALEAQRGDLCIRTDEGKSYILAQSPATNLDNWKWLKTPDSKILSVNGQTGAVTLTAAHIGAAPESHLATVATAETLGHIKSGGGLSVGGDGALSINSIDGGVVVA